MTPGKASNPIRSRQTRLWRAVDNPKHSGSLLLDTHIWLWMLEGDLSRASPALPNLLQRAAASGKLAVSDICFWEVSLKASKRKITLSIDTPIWLARAERAPGVAYLPLDRTVLVQSTRLSGALHGDSADRMLVATAQLHGMSLVTVDKLIIDYAASQPGIPVCDARA